MKIKVIERGETEFTASTEWTEPDIRAALATDDKDGNVRSAAHAWDAERDTDSDQYIIIAEAGGAVLWSGWLSGHLKDKSAPGAVELERDEAREHLVIAATALHRIRHMYITGEFAHDTAHAALDKIGAATVPAPGARGDDDPVGRLLALPLPENDLGASTVREALSRALSVAWRDGGNWSPTGNSDWQHILYRAMTEAGMARIGYGEDGYATEPETAPSYAEANAAITAAIERLGAS